MPLGLSLFHSLKNRESNIRIPSYDKSAHNGAGDRVPEEQWDVVNKPGEKPIDVIIFEGWCVAFRPLTNEAVAQKWHDAVNTEAARKQRNESPSGRLGFNRLEDALFVNDALRSYDQITDFLDAFVFLDAEETQYVYDWRLEQERKLREEKGSGMSDERVREFVDGYYPAYELFTQRLRKGVFTDMGEEGKGRQLRLTVGRDRGVVGDEVT